MEYELKQIRLDKLNIPAETLRRQSSRSQDEKLLESIRQYGIFVPLVITELGKGEYAIWDGTRRVRLMRKLGKPGSTLIAAKVVEGTDADSVVAQMNINQLREQLSGMAEAEALRQMVEDHGRKQKEAAQLLLKSSSWASHIVKVWQLPENILASLKAGEIGISHAKVLAYYIEKPEILKLLFETAKKGGISHPHLAALGVRAAEEGIKKAGKMKPVKFAVGRNSWIRIAPLRKGVRAELHLEDSDDPKTAAEKLLQHLESIKN